MKINYNYLTNYEKVILFNGLKKIYENYDYRTFVIIINKVNGKNIKILQILH